MPIEKAAGYRVYGEAVRFLDDQIGLETTSEDMLFGSICRGSSLQYAANIVRRWAKLPSRFYSFF